MVFSIDYLWDSCGLGSQLKKFVLLQQQVIASVVHANYQGIVRTKIGLAAISNLSLGEFINDKIRGVSSPFCHPLADTVPHHNVSVKSTD